MCLRTRRGRGAEEVKVEAPTMFDVVAEPVPDDAPFFYRVESLERGPGFHLILLGRALNHEDCRLLGRLRRLLLYHGCRLAFIPPVVPLLLQLQLI